MTQPRARVLRALKDSEAEFFTPVEMIVAVAAKKKRRAAKGLPFNCIVLDRDSIDGDEFKEFLNFLEKEKTKIPSKTRFQIIYRTDAHWSAIDVLVKDGELQFYLFDAANLSKTILPAISKIHEICPKAMMLYSGGHIQRDGRNCASFALDSVFRMSKIPTLHEELDEIIQRTNPNEHKHYIDHISQELERNPKFAKKTTKEKILEAVQHLRVIFYDLFPENFGPLLRNMQDYDILKARFFNPPMRGNDKVSLKDYVNAKTEKRTSKNNAVIAKRRKIKAKTATFLRALDERTYVNLFKQNKDCQNLWNNNESKEQKVEAREDVLFLIDLKQSLIRELAQYIAKREDEAKSSNSQYHSFWGKLTGMSGSIKISAARKLCTLLEEKPILEEFSDGELDALRNARLGKIVSAAERKRLLPSEFLKMECRKIICRRLI